MFKVNNKNIKTTSMTFSGVVIVNFEHISHVFSSVFVVEYEQVNVKWGLS